MACQYLNPREYADFWGVHYTTVYRWLSAGLLPGVIVQKLFQSIRYYIPVNTPPPRLYPGPKPGRRAKMEALHCD